jgi:addiction module HigA family antidote
MAVATLRRCLAIRDPCRKKLKYADEESAAPGRFCVAPVYRALGLTITHAAAALGVTRTTLSELVNEKRGISPEMAVRLSKVFGGSAATWLTQQAHYELSQVRADRIKLKRLEFA